MSIYQGLERINFCGGLDIQVALTPGGIFGATGIQGFLLLNQMWEGEGVGFQAEGYL